MAAERVGFAGAADKCDAAFAREKDRVCDSVRVPSAIQSAYRKTRTGWNVGSDARDCAAVQKRTGEPLQEKIQRQRRRYGDRRSRKDYCARFASRFSGEIGCAVCSVTPKRQRGSFS